MPKLLRKLRRWFEPKVDPERVPRVFEEFDDRRGYRAWHERCRALLVRPLPAGDSRSAVAKDGLAVL